MERRAGARAPHRIAQRVDIVDQQPAPSVKQVDGEEVHAAGNPVAAVIRHRAGVFGNLLKDTGSALLAPRGQLAPTHDAALMHHTSVVKHPFRLSQLGRRD